MQRWFFSKQPRSRSLQVISLLAIALLVSVSGCRQGSRTADQLAEDSDAAEDIQSNLVFNNVTLEQADPEGQPIWEVEAEQVIYSQDRQRAEMTQPNGEFFQDGEAIFNVKAETGEVEQDGERIVLTGNVVVTDLDSGAVIQSDRMEWIPEEGFVLFQGNVTGTHPKMRFMADEGKIYNTERRVEVSGNVRATSRDPNLQLEAETLSWWLDEGRVVSDRPVRIGRLAGNKVTDAAAGGSAELDLNAQVVTLRQNAQLDLQNPPMLISSNELIWNLEQQLLVSEQPITINNRNQRVVMTASQGRINLAQETAYLVGNVQAVAQSRQSRLNSDRLTWYLNREEFLAEGNVDYRQNQPEMRVQGPRAEGKLENETIVVSGGRVTTEIVPE